MLRYDVKAKNRLISRKFFETHEVFSPEHSLNQPKAPRICIRSINQSNCFISVRLLVLLCLQIFILRSYENHFVCRPLSVLVNIPYDILSWMIILTMLGENWNTYMFSPTMCTILRLALKRVLVLQRGACSFVDRMFLLSFQSMYYEIIFS